MAPPGVHPCDGRLRLRRQLAWEQLGRHSPAALSRLPARAHQLGPARGRARLQRLHRAHHLGHQRRAQLQLRAHGAGAAAR